MALIALLAAIVSPAFFGNATRDFNEAVQQAYLVLKKARAEALMERRDSGVRFGRMTEPVEGVRNWSRADLEVSLIAPGHEGAVVKPPQVAFYPDGTSSGGTLELRSSGLHKRIVISPESGRISIEQPE